MLLMNDFIMYDEEIVKNLKRIKELLVMRQRLKAQPSPIIAR